MFYKGNKNLGDIVAIRAQQMQRIRKAQMTIAIIDATVTTDPGFEEQFEQYDGDIATAFPPVQQLETNPFAQFN